MLLFDVCDHIAYTSFLKHSSPTTYSGNMTMNSRGTYNKNVWKRVHFKDSEIQLCHVIQKAKTVKSVQRTPAAPSQERPKTYHPPCLRAHNVRPQNAALKFQRL